MANSQDITISFSSTHPAIIDQIVPLRLLYSFTQDINVPEDQIPFINPAIFIQDYPQLNIAGSFSYLPYVYGDNYYLIKGDSTIVYQGFSPFRTKFTQPEITNGNILLSHTSKWFKGTLQWTNGGDSYEIIDGNVLEILCFYDVVNSGLSNPALFNYKTFQSSTFDSITGTTITGQGTRKTYTMVEVSPGVFQQNITEERLVEETVTLEEDITVVTARGFKYKNAVFQGYTGDSGFTIKTTGSLDGSGLVESPYNGGLDDITGFSYTHETLPDNDNVPQLTYKLYYSSLRESQFNFHTDFQLYSLPDKSSHLNPSDSLPYAQFTVEVNPDGYPLVVLDDTTVYSHSSHTETWTKLNDNKFIYSCSGTLILSAPADQLGSQVVDSVDETYSNDGDTYTRDLENRPDKEVPNYFPSLPQLKVKLILSTIPNVESLNNRKIELNNGSI